MSAITKFISSILLLLLFDRAGAASQAEWDRVTKNLDLKAFPDKFQTPPPPHPAYMVDDADNKKGLAPTRGIYNRISFR